MSTIAIIILVIYTIALTYIMVFCLMQFHLLYHYKKNNGGRTDVEPEEVQAENYPHVTVQLPLYNELYVAARLIDNIVLLDYPKDKLEIQVLDDSTDETVAIVADKVSFYKKLGFDISHIRREIRTGFKAGALQEGLLQAKGEFMAIFDADFLPYKHFLKSTISNFKDSNIGVVQTRWEHINQDYSLLTKLQAFQLNVHFTVEQTGRQGGNYMLQFNGTAGVWRKETVLDAGGWNDDTLTEDLDLSYRAQLKGWKIRYLEGVGSPAELPAEMNSLKAQQYRWMKGGAETAKKILPNVWQSNLSVSQKFHATMHLLASGIFVFVFVVGVFSVPMLFAMEVLSFNENIFAVFLTSLISIAFVYYVGNQRVFLKKGDTASFFLKFIFIFPLFLALSMGLSLHNSIAVLQGYFGKKTPFIRTPKFNIRTIGDTLKKKNYLPTKIPLTTFFEGLLSLYFLVGMIYGIQTGNTYFILFHFMLVIGFGAICYYSIRHSFFNNR